MTENPRHREFARRIVWHRDTAAEAYRRAGYSVTNASSATSGAHRVMQHPDVQAMMIEEEARLSEALAVDEQRIARELSAIATADITDVLDWAAQHIQSTDDNAPTAMVTVRDTADIPAHVRRCIKSFRVTRQGIQFEMHDKLTALSHLARIRGMFRDNLRLTVQDVDAMTEAELEAEEQRLRERLGAVEQGEASASPR